MIADHLLKRIDAPEDMFGPGKYIMRRKKIKVKSRDMIRSYVAAGDEHAMYEYLAKMIPRWEINDCWSDDPLANPEDDPSVYVELDGDEFRWVMEQLNPKKADSDETSATNSDSSSISANGSGGQLETSTTPA